MQNLNSFNPQEDITYLEEWLKDAESLALDISMKAKNEGGLAAFTVGSTIKQQEDLHPYLTPLREITHGHIGGAIVFSQTQAILLANRIDGLVDKILVDAEKKIGITLDIDYSVLEHFKITRPETKNRARVSVEMGNLSSACISYIKKSQFHEYKPNDMTVEAIWHFLADQLGAFSGKKVTIIGCGNIGFKLALKLVECGVHVELVRRDMSKGMLMANVINITKPASTIAIANYNSNPLQASLFSDVLIGCTNGVAAITWEMIQSMNKGGIVIDVGKGCVSHDAAQKAVEHNIPILRCDVSSAFDGLIATMQRNSKILLQEMGRREIEKGVFIVSGGFLGLRDDIVVDNYRNPSRIIGVANGRGDFKKELSENDLSRLLIIKKRSNYAKA